MKLIKIKTTDGPREDFEAEQLRRAVASKVFKLYGDFRAAQREVERLHKLKNSEETKKNLKRFESLDFYIRALINEL